MPLIVRIGKPQVRKTKTGKTLHVRRVRARANDAESMQELFAGIAAAVSQPKAPRWSKPRKLRDWQPLLKLSIRQIHRLRKKGRLIDKPDTIHGLHAFRLDSAALRERNFRESDTV